MIYKQRRIVLILLFLVLMIISVPLQSHSAIGKSKKIICPANQPYLKLHKPPIEIDATCPLPDTYNGLNIQPNSDLDEIERSSSKVVKPKLNIERSKID